MTKSYLFYFICAESFFFQHFFPGSQVPDNWFPAPFYLCYPCLTITFRHAFSFTYSITMWILSSPNGT